MKLLYIKHKNIKYYFNKDNIKWKKKLKTCTHSNIESYLINNEIVIVSNDYICFVCEKCKKNVEMKFSNFKIRKHNLCISCIRKKTINTIHKNRSNKEKKDINKKISIKTKETISKFSKEKKDNIYKKMKLSLDWDKRNKKWQQTMSKKTNEERKDINKKISISIKKKYKENGPWNLKNYIYAPLNKNIPENKWFKRGLHSSNEKIKVTCSDCLMVFESLRGNLAKQEKKHPGKIYCINCKNKDERNGCWIDGRKWNSDNSYTIKFKNNEFRKIIMKKQYNICPICNEEFEKSAHLHHIDYDKKNDDIKNLIFLHNSCHSKTNFNRKFWKTFFNNYYKYYYEELKIEDKFIEKYFKTFPLINLKISKEFILSELKTRRKFNPNKPPSTVGRNLSKLLNQKYFYSRKGKNNSSIIEILKSNKIKEIYKYNDSFSQVIYKITSQLYSYPVSIFSHHLMDWILTKWSKQNDIIYDPAGGFGGRLIGTYWHNIKYISTDPFTYNELQNIANILNLNVKIYPNKSEDLKIKCDMVVCCPPYHNTENYMEIEKRDYNTWLKQYWVKTLKNIKAKKFVLIISHKYPEIIKEVSKIWKEKERFVITNKSFKSKNIEYIIYFEK